MNADRILLLTALILVGALTGLAQTISWDGGGDGVSWSDPLNWSGDQLPGPTNDVVIPGGAGPMVVFSGTMTFRAG